MSIRLVYQPSHFSENYQIRGGNAFTRGKGSTFTNFSFENILDAVNLLLNKDPSHFPLQVCVIVDVLKNVYTYQQMFILFVDEKSVDEFIDERHGDLNMVLVSRRTFADRLMKLSSSDVIHSATVLEGLPNLSEDWYTPTKKMMTLVTPDGGKVVIPHYQCGNPSCYDCHGEYYVPLRGTPKYIRWRLQDKEQVRRVLRIPEGAEVTTDCISYLSANYCVFDDGSKPFMDSKAMLIMKRATGLCISALALQWYSLCLNNQNEVIELLDDVQLYIRKMPEDLLRQVYLAAGLRASEIDDVCSLCGDRKSHNPLVCVRLGTYRKRIQIMKERQACTGCGVLGCTIGDDIHPDKFNLSCTLCKGTRRGHVHASYLCSDYKFWRYGLSKKIAQLQSLAYCARNWSNDDFERLMK